MKMVLFLQFKQLSFFLMRPLILIVELSVLQLAVRESFFLNFPRILVAMTPKWQCMNYRGRLGSLGNSATASGNTDPGDGIPQLYLGHRNFFFFGTRCTSFYIHPWLRAFFLLVLVLFQSPCSHEQLFGQTPVHEFFISYSHAERSFFSEAKLLFFGRSSPVKN